MPLDPSTSPPDVAGAVDVVLPWLRDALGDTPVGDHRLPDVLTAGTGWAILYQLGGAVGGPSYWAPEADAVLSFQVTSCGRTREQAQRVAQRVRERFCGRDEKGRLLHELDLSAIGRDAVDRGLSGSLGHTEYEGGIFSVVEQFYVAV